MSADQMQRIDELVRHAIDVRYDAESGQLLFVSMGGQSKADETNYRRAYTDEYLMPQNDEGEISGPMEPNFRPLLGDTRLTTLDLIKYLPEGTEEICVSQLDPNVIHGFGDPAYLAPRHVLPPEEAKILQEHGFTSIFGENADLYSQHVSPRDLEFF